LKSPITSRIALAIVLCLFAPPAVATAAWAGHAAPAAQVGVSVVDFAYEPQHASAAIGDTVRFTFDGPTNHTVTSDLAGLFDSGEKAATETFDVFPGAAATYLYHCEPHPEMTGSIGVPLRAVGPTGDSPITLEVDAGTPPVGFVVDIQVQRGAGPFEDVTGDADGVAEFVPQLAGRYRFQARLRDPSTEDKTAFSPQELFDVPTSAVTLTTPTSTPRAGREFSLRGKLTFGDGPAADRPLQLFVTEPGEPERLLRTIRTAQFGTYSSKVVPTEGGRTTYRAEFDGDAGHLPAGDTLVRNVAKLPSRLTIAGRPNPVPPGDPVTVSGRLDFDYGPLAGRTVRVTIDPPSGPLRTRSVTTRTGGAFSLTFQTTQLGVHLLRASWTGDEAHLSDTSEALRLAVRKLESSIGIRLSRTAVPYGGEVRVTAHLGAFRDTRQRVVRILAKPHGGTARAIESGPVDSRGNLSVVFEPGRNTTFFAVWDGDRRYLDARSREASVGVRSSIRGVFSGHYGTYKGWKLVEAGDRVTFSTQVTPAQPREFVFFVLEVFTSSGWQTLDIWRYRQNGKGRVGTWIVFKEASNGHGFRLGAAFLDDDHLDSATRWTYLIVDEPGSLNPVAAATVGRTRMTTPSSQVGWLRDAFVAGQR
jgi:plastocyanin